MANKSKYTLQEVTSPQLAREFLNLPKRIYKGNRNWVCPLDERMIDVAVAAAEAGDRFDPHGIACAYRAGVPLVTVGATPNDPVLRYATAAVGRVDQELLDVLVDVRTSP